MGDPFICKITSSLGDQWGTGRNAFHRPETTQAEDADTLVL